MNKGRVFGLLNRAFRASICLLLVGFSGPCLAEPKEPWTQLAARIVAPPQQCLRNSYKDGEELKYERESAYTLLLTNSGSSSLRLKLIEITNAADHTIIKKLDENDIANQISTFNSSGVELPKGESASIRIILSFPVGTNVPLQIANRIQYSVKRNGVDVDESVLPQPISLQSNAPLLMNPPVRGSNWVVWESRTAMGLPIPVSSSKGEVIVPHAYASEWMMLDSSLRSRTGEPSANTSSPCYGQPVFSVTDGTVADMHFGEPDEPRGYTTQQFKSNPAGNWIQVSVDKNAMVFYGYLKPGSAKVNVGDRVSAGQQLAEIGNSGNSSKPRLYLNVFPAEKILTESKSYVFESYKVIGQTVSLTEFENNDNAGSPQPVTATGAHPLRQYEFPWNSTVLSIPEIQPSSADKRR